LGMDTPAQSNPAPQVSGGLDGLDFGSAPVQAPV